MYSRRRISLPGLWLQTIRGIAWIICPSGLILVKAGGWCSYQLACHSQEDQGSCLLTLSGREIKPALTQIADSSYAWPHTQTLEDSLMLVGTRLQQCVCVCVHMETNRTNTRLCWESVTLGPVQLGTQTDKCGWAVTPRQLVVKGCLSICALIWLIVFSQASSVSLSVCLSPPPPPLSFCQLKE